MDCGGDSRLWCFVTAGNYTCLKTSNPWVVKLSWLANAYSRPLLSAGDLGQGDQVFDVGLCMQEYKFLCTAVTTYATLVVPKLIRTL